MTKETKHKAYILHFPHASDLMGVVRLVKWCHGHGVLDRRAVANVRPDLIDAATFENIAGYDIIEATRAYWADRGCVIKEATEEETEVLRDQLEKYPDRFRPGAKATPVQTSANDTAPEPEKIAVSALAKELGLHWKDVADKLSAAGIDVANHSSKVEAGPARAVFASAATSPATATKDPAPHEVGG